MPIDRNYASEQINFLVFGGFRSAQWIEERVLEDCFLPEDVTEDDAIWVGKRVEWAWSAKLEEEKTWPSLTDWDKLDAAFAALRAAGVIALHQAGTEQSDGWTEVAEKHHAAGAGDSSAIGFCFYHQQDVEIAIKGDGLMLSFGDIDRDFILADPVKGVEIGQRVVAEIEKVGLRAVWNGQMEQRIHLEYLRWQKRYRPGVADDR